MLPPNTTEIFFVTRHAPSSECEIMKLASGQVNKEVKRFETDQLLFLHKLGLSDPVHYSKRPQKTDTSLQL